MIQEALEFLQATAVEATDVKIHTVPGNERLLLIQHGGREVTQMAVPAPPRRHKVGSIADLADLTEELDAGGENRPVVWHSYSKVVLVVDGTDRRDFATMDLEYGDQFAALRRLETADKDWFSQRDLIYFLRVGMKGCINLPDLIDNLRRIRFRIATSGESDVQHGKESLGKAVEAEVSGSQPIPDSVIVNVKVYRNLGETERFPVECALDIDTENQRFRFRPMADELEMARQQAQGSIRSRLKESLPEEINVYFGEP